MDEVTQVLFGMDGFEVLGASMDDVSGDLVVLVETLDVRRGCPGCVGVEVAAGARVARVARVTFGASGLTGLGACTRDCVSGGSTNEATRPGRAGGR